MTHRFRRQGDGILINVASVIGKVPAPYFASYTPPPSTAASA